MTPAPLQAVFGWPEFTGMLLLIIILVLLQWWPQWFRGDRAEQTGVQPFRNGFVVWIAQGFGIGRIPWAPGTFGSLLGLGWLVILSATGNFWWFLVGIGVGIGLSVWLSGAAEKILNQPDPASVVVDEIVAVPIGFVPWVASVWAQQQTLPAPGDYFSGANLAVTGGLFILFRVFDIAKPWPVRQSQRLPGGWGITVDDVLAATFVALISLIWVA